MRALRLHGALDARVEDVPGPGDPGPGEVLVAPRVAGLCGTDVHMYEGARPAGMRGPQILGHELAGEVVAVGPGVTSVRAGDRVAVVPIVACGRCRLCMEGLGQLCPGHESVGLRHPWGGLGELALVRDTQVAAIPDSMSYTAAALVEPASVAATGIESSGVGPGSSVLIVGAGPVGVLAAMGAEAAGATDVVLSEPGAHRATRARELGFEVVDPTAVDVAEWCRERSGGLGFDLAVDCAGNQPAVTTALGAVRPGGRVSITAVHGPPVEVDLRALLSRNITLTGAVAYPVWSWPRKIAQVASGKLPVERVVTSSVPLAEGVTRGLDALARPDTTELKVVIEVSPG